MSADPTTEEVTLLADLLDERAEAGGYHLNPDRQFVESLARGLLVNEARYGYQSCPCRLAAGEEAADRDIVCPCDYRDPDLTEFGACYCALYVSGEILRNEKEARSIPERRPPPEQRQAAAAQAAGRSVPGELPYPVWRCKVCGYLCARHEPPELCPVCKARKERFERFM